MAILPSNAENLFHKLEQIKTAAREVEISCVNTISERNTHPDCTPLWLLHVAAALGTTTVCFLGRKCIEWRQDLLRIDFQVQSSQKQD